MALDHHLLGRRTQEAQRAWCWMKWPVQQIYCEHPSVSHCGALSQRIGLVLHIRELKVSKTPSTSCRALQNQTQPIASAVSTESARLFCPSSNHQLSDILNVELHPPTPYEHLVLIWTIQEQRIAPSGFAVGSEVLATVLFFNPSICALCRCVSPSYSGWR